MLFFWCLPAGLGLSFWCPCTVQFLPMTWFADSTFPHVPQTKLHNATHVIIRALMSGKGQLAVDFSWWSFAKCWKVLLLHFAAFEFVPGLDISA